MTPPFAERREEIVEGFLVWPEIAEKILGVTREDDMLLHDQLAELGMPFSNIFFSHRHS
jgi:hypothetical protein